MSVSRSEKLATHVLVAGAGYVGKALAARLLDRGVRVTAINRSSPTLPLGCGSLRVDLSQPIEPEQLPSNVTHVAYCAAAKGGGEAGYRNIYVDGQKHLAKALSKLGAPIRRWVFTSSTAVYGQTNGELVGAESATEPTRYQGKVMLEAEAVAAEYGYSGVALRLAGIYGPQRTRLVSQVAKGEASRRPLATISNRIHVDDCAGAAEHLLFLSNPQPAYLGVDDEPCSMGQVRGWLAEQLKVPCLDEPLNPNTAPLGKRCSNERLKAAGYSLQYKTYRDGYPEVVRRYRAGLVPPPLPRTQRVDWGRLG